MFFHGEQIYIIIVVSKYCCKIWKKISLKEDMYIKEGAL